MQELLRKLRNKPTLRWKRELQIIIGIIDKLKLSKNFYWNSFLRQRSFMDLNDDDVAGPSSQEQFINVLGNSHEVTIFLMYSKITCISNF